MRAYSVLCAVIFLSSCAPAISHIEDYRNKTPEFNLYLITKNPQSKDTIPPCIIFVNSVGDTTGYQIAIVSPDYKFYHAKKEDLVWWRIRIMAQDVRFEGPTKKFSKNFFKYEKTSLSFIGIRDEGFCETTHEPFVFDPNHPS